MVSLDEGSPIGVTKLCGAGGRVHDVGEQNGGEDAAEHRILIAHLSQEACNFRDDGIPARGTSAASGHRRCSCSTRRAPGITCARYRLLSAVYTESSPAFASTSVGTWMVG